MTTSKTIEKSALEKLRLTSEFSRVLIAFIYCLLDTNSNELQKHWIKSIFFSLVLILDRMADLFIAINFIKLENKNFLTVFTTD